MAESMVIGLIVAAAAMWLARALVLQLRGRASGGPCGSCGARGECAALRALEDMGHDNNEGNRPE